MFDVFVSYSLLLTVTSVSMIALAAFSFLRRKAAGALIFSFLCIACFCYCFGSLFEISSMTYRRMFSSLVFEYIGISFLGPLWMNCAVRISVGSVKRYRYLLWLSFVPSVIILLSVATNEMHHLFYRSLTFRECGEFSVAHIVPGPWYLFHYGYFIFCAVIGLIFVFRAIIVAKRSDRNQFLFLLAGLLVPWISNVIYSFGLSPCRIDIGPLGLGISCGLLSIAVFRFRLFDIIPLAYEQVFQSANDAILVFDNQNRLLAANSAWKGLFPETAQIPVGSPADAVFQGNEILLGTLRHTSQLAADYSVDRKNGRIYFEVVPSLLRDYHGEIRGTILFLHDVSARVQLLRKLEQEAMTDGLTGTANRRCFEQMADTEFVCTGEQGHMIALGMFDIDRFKQINDQFGHGAGDAVLREVINCCRQILAPGDFIARFGGDEFVILFDQNRREPPEYTAERLRVAIESLRIAWEKASVCVTVSIGLIIPDGHSTPRKLLTAADEALYKAKADGGNRVVMSQPPKKA